MAKTKVSYAPSIRRLPSYLTIIKQVQQGGSRHISGTIIAQELNLEPIQVRKDLAITGIIGKPKKGYPIQELVQAIEHYLGWDESHDAVLVGAGNLGSALMGYQEFRLHGLRVVAAFDSEPAKIGGRIHEVPVYPIESLEEKIGTMRIELAILTVPSPFAQAMTEILVRAGVRSIWNFTNVKLKVPEGIIVQREDLSSGYAMLSVMTRQAAEKNAAEGADSRRR